MSFRAAVSAAMLATVIGADKGCVYPGDCTPPKALHSVMLPVQPRQQWGNSGGFCGSLSVQTSALMYGNWISQMQVRMANTHGEGHGNPQQGYEILPTNIEESLTNLALTFEAFDYNQPKPQSDSYKQFLKKHLTNQHPVVWFVMCKGDGDQIPYPGSNPNGGRFSHIEPVWGYFTNYSITDDIVREQDVIVHGSDWDRYGYFRPMNTLVDTPLMEGNCKNAGNHSGINEMYPCIYNEVDYGYAVTGNVDPQNMTLPSVLSVDSWNEPDMMNPTAVPSQLHGNLTISGLSNGVQYVIYRYSGRENVPRGSSFDQKYEHKTVFTATNESYKFIDPNYFMSNSSTFYRVVKA
eukprot:TRINITY_DN6976_c2_g1_i1.p1 TRINITY_DN6976_c2_g1~~TRINITY_DN6976_c2_g1_i1.p1  ORF type:complete len:372 (+),score=52.37 TRINITY_DN6976_c2_g1_i1:68-1117(+)